MKTKRKLLSYLRSNLKHLEYYNNMAPFPVYDTEYVESVRNKIKEMETNSKYDYDEDPVWACKYCKEIHIMVDDDDNSHCMRCGAINELIEFETIYKYKEFKDAKNT